MDLTAKRWDAMSPAERRATAKAVARELPAGFEFDAIRACRRAMSRRCSARPSAYSRSSSRSHADARCTHFQRVASLWR